MEKAIDSMTKGDLVKVLVIDDIDFILGNPHDTLYIEMLLTGGFAGYDNMTREELSEEYHERLANQAD